MKRLLIAALLLAGGVAAAPGLVAQQTEAPTGTGPQGQAAEPAGPPPAPEPVTLSSRPAASGGEALYIEHCMHCHGENGMGTGLLARRVQPAMLEARDNLPAEYVIVVARQGVGNMPPIPRGEVSDEDLQQIADYLAAGPHPAATGARP